MIPASTAKPEELYQTTTDKTERRKLQVAVLQKWADRLHVAVTEAAWRYRVTLNEDQLAEAAQVAKIGLLLALEKYEPSKLKSSNRGVGAERDGWAFWSYAKYSVNDELQNWFDHGVFWRPRTRKARNVRNIDGSKIARLQMTCASMDESTGVEDAATTLHDVTADPSPTPEQQASDREAAGLLCEFSSTLSREDGEILFSEDPRRVRSRRHVSLIADASAFVKGESDGGAQVGDER